MSKKSLFLITALIILLAINITPQDSNMQKGVSIYQLGNGLKVLMIENRALPMIGVNVVVKTGSAYETFSTSGMSHMLEHLLFNGTKTRTQKELYDETDLIGGYNNANTSDYYTNYMMVTPAENIKKGMEIQADMLFNSTLPVQKFEKEKGIVLEEISKSIVKPTEQKERNISSILFDGHSLSLPTLGTFSTIKNLKRDDVFRYYKNRYVPNNMILSVIGNFRSKDMLKMIKKIYGFASPGIVTSGSSNNFHSGFENLPEKIDTMKIYHRFYGGKVVITDIFFPLKTRLGPLDIKVLEVILREKGRALRRNLTSGLKKSLKNISLKLLYTPVRSFLHVEAQMKGRQDPNLIVQETFNSLNQGTWELNKGVFDSQISGLRTSFLKNIEKPHMFGIFNANSFAVFGIESVLSSYDKFSFRSAAEKIKTLDYSIKPVVIINHPAEEQKSSVSGRILKPRLFTDNDSGKILITEQNPGSGLIAIHLLFKNKARIEGKFGAGLSSILHYCFEKRLKSPENIKTSSKFGLSYKLNDNPYFPMDDIYMNPDFSYMRFEALSEYHEDIIKFIMDNLSNYIPEQDELNYALKKISRSHMMKMGAGLSTKERFSRLVDNTFYTQMKISKMKPDLNTLRDFANIYLKTSNIIISVVSPVGSKKINSFFDQYFKKGSYRELPASLKLLVTPPKQITIKKDSGGDRSYLFFGFVKDTDPEDIGALKALSLVLNDMITFDIRERKGMAYRMSSGIKTVGNKALFYINMGTLPKNVHALIKVFSTYFSYDKIRNVENTDVKKLLNKYLGRMMFRRLSSINRSYYLAYSYYFHKDIYFDSNSLNKLKKIGVEDVKKAAKKYLKIENPVLIQVR